MTEFARRESINYTTFVGWVWKSGGPSTVGSPIKFAEVKLPAMKHVAPGTSGKLEGEKQKGQAEKVIREKTLKG